MNTISLATSADLAVSSVLEAYEQINLLEAGQLKKAVDFVELQYSPDLEQQNVAEVVATYLLKRGIGIKLTLHWPFKGTTKWALQTSTTRVVSGL